MSDAGAQAHRSFFCELFHLPAMANPHPKVGLVESHPLQAGVSEIGLIYKRTLELEARLIHPDEEKGLIQQCGDGTATPLKAS